MKNSFGYYLQKYFKMPHTYVLLVIIILLAAIMTYIVPSGEFERTQDEQSGQTVVVPGTYQNVDADPFNPLLFPASIVEGFNDASDVIFFIIIIGGTFQIILSTGAVDAITSKITKVFSTKRILVIPALLTVFSIGGFTMGMSTESMIFVPIGILIARSFGYDALVGTAIVVLGTNLGFTAGLLNPFSVGVAQSIAEVPIFSGLWLRAIILICILIIASLYIMRYALKVRNNPSYSYIADIEKNADHDSEQLFQASLTKRHIAILILFGIGILILLYGVLRYEWYITEISSLFLGMGIVAGLTYGYGPSRLSKEFVHGASNIIMGALMIGLARAVIVVLEEGLIIDTMVYLSSNAIDILPSSLQVLGIYGFQLFINIFITSGSGQAAITMPIITPLADLLGVSRQTGVLAFQLGDGFTNLLNPTSSTIMGALAVSGIPFSKWFKFAFPIILLLIIFGGIMVVIANLINYS